MSIPALDCVIELRRWIVWRTELRNGKPAKVPYSPVTGRLAKANDPETWTDHRTATAAVGRLVNGGSGGIGLMLGDLGNAQALGGIDLDTCRAPDGEIDPWATEVIDRLATYAEISPSGTGVKMFLQYALSDLPELRQLMGTDYGKLWKRAGGDHPPSIELHLGNRYFAVTGQHLMSTPAVVQPVSLETLRWVIEGCR